MYKKLIIIALFVSSGAFTLLTAQVLHAGISAAGGNATGTGGSASYSVGQLVFTTATGTTGSVAQGVQQPFEINVISAIKDIYGIELLSAYPNPASTHLIIKIKDNELSTFSYQMFDINGSMIRTAKVTDIETNINLANLTPATYFLKILAESKEVKTFKIIKK